MTIRYTEDCIDLCDFGKRYFLLGSLAGVVHLLYSNAGVLMMNSGRKEIYCRIVM